MIPADQILSSHPTISPFDYFTTLEANFSKAFQQSRGQGKTIRLGPFVVRLKFLNEVLIERVTKAWSHLFIPTADCVDFEIGIWDTISTGVGLQAPPWTELMGGHVQFNKEGTFIRYDYPTGIFQAYDSNKKLGFFWMENADQFPDFEIAAPFRTLLDWRFKDTNLQLVHGGAIGTSKGGVLISAPGGSGKSTTCSLAFRSDLFFLGDDYCLADTGPNPKIFNLYGTTKLCPDARPKFPELEPAVFLPSYGKEQKIIYFVQELFPQKIISELPLKAVLIPKITRNKYTRISPIAPIKALTALAPTTAITISRSWDYSFKKSASLVRRVPCFQLELGGDLDEIPPLIKSFIGEL